MSKRRYPDLEPDYRYIDDIDKGGFAQVYLYEQVRLGRSVAVKVLRARGLRTKDYQDILDEARAMAQLDGHPNIVSVFEARMSRDDQPCIIMMYCGGPNLWTLVQQGELDVRKVVRLGIDIAGAVQAAHDKKIVHRDIKPSNILTDEYGNPRLTDFGIAGTLTQADRDKPFGMSVPWSPPEILEGGQDGHGSVASDIYSLGATLYHLLAGRSPFARAGERDTEDEMIRRICTTSAPRLGRPVPADLESFILGMLSPRPEQRPRSARAVADRLSRIEQDEWGGPPSPEGSWHVGGLVTGSSPTLLGQTVVRGAPLVPAARTAGRGAEESERTWVRTQHKPGAGETGPRRRSSVWVWAAAMLVVIGGIVGVGLAMSDGPRTPAATGPSESPVDQGAGTAGDNLPPGPPTVTAVRVNDETLRFTWTYTSNLPSDTYLWRTTDGGQSGEAGTNSVELTHPRGSQLCLEIKVVRADGSYANVDWSAQGCGS